MNLLNLQTKAPVTTRKIIVSLKSVNISDYCGKRGFNYMVISH